MIDEINNNGYDESKTDESVNKSDTTENVYGVIYTPDKDRNEYIAVNYNTQPQNNDSETKKKQKNKRTESSKRALLVCITAILAVLFASGCSLLTAMLIADHYESMIAEYNNAVSGTTEYTEKDHYVFVDDSNHEVITQNKDLGELLTMEEAIQIVKDSVVEITTERVQSGFGSYSQYVVSGAGSGVIISTRGYIITNNHVIEGANNIIVRLTNGKEYSAKLIATDSKTDVAVISITPDEGEILTTAVIGSSNDLNLGQTVIAIGNPLGKLGGTVSNGIISCLAREIAMDGSGTMTLLQTNAAVSPGNSGGGLFDLYGRLIGIVNAKSTGQGVEGISFAIPIDTAWDVAGQLIEKGYVSGRPSLGASVKQVEYGYSIFGEYYYQLVVTSADSQSKLKVNDVIYAIDNVEVNTVSDVNEILAAKKIGDKITVAVRRDRRNIQVEVVLVEFIPTDVDAK